MAASLPLEKGRMALGISMPGATQGLLHLHIRTCHFLKVLGSHDYKGLLNASERIVPGVAPIATLASPHVKVKCELLYSDL